MLRVIREVQPSFVVGENVRGLTNWNGGLVFDEVQADLENEGYEVLPFLLPACAVNAPHRRDRIWFIAYSRSNGLKLRGLGENRSEAAESIKFGKERERVRCNSWGISKQGIVTDSESRGQGRLRNETETPRPPESSELSGSVCRIQHATNASDFKLQGSKFNRSTGSTRTPESEGGQFSGPVRTKWDQFPTQPPICSRNDGISGKLDGITFPKWRNESLKAYGNAIVPQVAFEIFKVINKMRELEEQL